MFHLCAKRIRRNCAVLIKCCMQETQPFEMVIITCIANPIRLVYHLEILRNLKRVGTHGLLNPPAGDAGYIPVIMIRWMQEHYFHSDPKSIPNLHTHLKYHSHASIAFNVKSGLASI